MKTTKLCFVLVIFLITIKTYSQNSNEFSLYFGISDTKFLNDATNGGAGYENEKFSEFGIKYFRQISKNLYIETGVNFVKSDIKITPEFMGVPVQSRSEKLEIISIPMYVNYSISKFLFVNGGPLLDFQTSNNTTNSQSGIGYGLGVGAKYEFSKLLVYLNPNFKRHAVIPFEKENNHQKLTEFGLQIGLGYKF